MAPKVKKTFKKLEKPEDTKHKILVDYCIDLRDEIKKSEYRQKKIKEITEARKAYEQDAGGSATYPWKDAANLVLPFETISVDNLEPRLVAGLTGRDPFVAIGEEGNQDEHDEAVETWFNKELKTGVKVEQLSRDVVHTLLLEGTWYTMPEYTMDELIKRDFVFDEEGAITFDENGQPLYEEFIAVTFDGVKAKTVPFTDIFVADDIDTPEKWESTDKIRLVHYTYAELLDKIGKPGYLDDHIGPWLLPTSTQLRLDEENKTPSQAVVGVDYTGKETIECLECHITYPISSVGEEEKLDESRRAELANERVIVTIAVESKLCIRKMLLREVNYNNEAILKRVRLFAEQGRSYGTSIHGKLKAIQEGGSDLFNKLLNVADICMLPWWLEEEESGVEGKQRIRPGEGVLVKNIDKLKFPEFFKINPNQYLEFFNIFVDLWERLITLSEPQMGKPREKDTTATEVMSLIEEGNIKHNYQSQTFKEEFLNVLRLIYDLYYRYMPYDKVIEYQGKEITLTRSLMKRERNFRLTGSTDKANKLLERKENENLFALLGNDPFMNPIQIREDIIKSYNREEVEKYIQPVFMQLLQMYMAAPDQVMQALEPIAQMIAEAEQGAEQTGGG